MTRYSMDLYFGSYTRSHPFIPAACGEGIGVCSFDPETGGVETRSMTSGILNPSYMTLDATGRYLIVCSENLEGEGAVCIFDRDPDGGLKKTGSQPSGGIATCHVCATPQGKICASSYLSGVLTVYPCSGGIIGKCESTFRYLGKSADVLRQTASHAHQAVVSPDGRWLYVCDLGADRIWCHPIGSGEIMLPSDVSVALPAGSGPRHLAFHPALPRVYVLCELSARVLTYDWDAGTGVLTFADDQPTLPSEWNGTPSASAIRIHPSGRALYVANRNHDSLTAFRLDEGGVARFATRFSSGGEMPRDFAIDPTGRWLLAANQASNCVGIHQVNPTSGLPEKSPWKTVPVKTPACVLFAEPIMALI